MYINCQELYQAIKKKILPNLYLSVFLLAGLITHKQLILAALNITCN